MTQIAKGHSIQSCNCNQEKKQVAEVTSLTFMQFWNKIAHQIKVTDYM